MPVETHPLSREAGAIFDRVTAVLNAVEASRWMFTGNEALDGCSPIQALKAGDIEGVQRAFFELSQGQSANVSTR